MFTSRRFARITLVAVSGLIAVVGLAPSTASASTTHQASVNVVKGPVWCC